MTRDEVKKLLLMVNASFPNFKVEDVGATVDAWHFLLGEYNAMDIMTAFKTYVSTNRSGFAPSVAELIGGIHKTEELAQMSDADAWAIVRKAISRGNYYAEKDFDAFPEVIKRAVGTPSQLRIWAMDENFNDGVESSNFYKRYKTEIERANTISWMPQEARIKLQELQQGLCIGVNNEN